jgi:trk system potassium uptake protein TrkA
MRAVFIGTTSLTLATARLLLKRGHEVVLIEQEKARIETLSEEIDCGFLHGDGSKPAILREADPAATNFLFCLTGNDQTNIIASLVGRSLGFDRVITRIEDPAFEHICIELGLKDTIIPTSTIARYLADMFRGMDLMELSGSIKGEARVFSFVIHPEDALTVAELNLPEETRPICAYRDDKFMLVDPETKLKENDEMVLITHSRHQAELYERWGNQTTSR